MKKITIFILFLLVFVSSSSVFAEELINTPTGVKVRNQIINEIKNEIKEKRQENKEERKDLLEQLKDKINTIKNSRVKIIDGTVDQISGSTLSISKDRKAYSINILPNTKIKRRFWGNALLSEIVVGHKVNVWGTYIDSDQTTIDARMIRDLSIQKRFGAFIGVVKSINGNVITIDTVNRGIQIITVSSSSKFVNRKEQVITQSEIKLGHKIRVKGIWDNVNNTITEVTHVKDFTLPVMPTPSIKSD